MQETQYERSIEDRQREASEAQRHMNELAQRVGTIDAEIAAERENIRQERIKAAKRGESVSGASQSDRLEELLRERDELPERHFAARLRSAAAGVSVEQAKIEQVTERIPEAEAVYSQLAEEAQQAEVKAAIAREQLEALYGQRRGAAERSRRQEKLLEEIEAQGPKPLV